MSTISVGKFCCHGGISLIMVHITSMELMPFVHEMTPFLTVSGLVSKISYCDYSFMNLDHNVKHQNVFLEFDD